MKLPPEPAPLSRQMPEALEIPTGILKGELTVPPSKSLTHRYLILGALSAQPVAVRNPLICEDTLVTLQALKQLGYDWLQTPGAVRFTGVRRPLTRPVTLNVGNSGTSARFFTALAILQNQPVTIDGSSRMRQRPMEGLIRALQSLGAEIRHRESHLPITVFPFPIRKTEVEVAAQESSQFLSALLLTAAGMPAGLTVRYRGEVASFPYVKMTLQILQQAGFRVDAMAEGFRVTASGASFPEELRVEGDFSNASYFLIGSAITGGTVVLSGLSRHSVQGDREIISILQQAGIPCRWREDGKLETRPGKVMPVDLEMNGQPDLVPAISVLALFGGGESRIRNVGHLKFKESDRIAAIVKNITRLGGVAFAEGNDLVIRPGAYRGGRVSTFNDHRIAMSFAVAGLKIPGVVVENPGCVEKSYPRFWEDFFSLISPQRG